ncbi:hypothetical protein [Comamonas sp.]|uniref:hypothetical protein n=1 Tax=Comamonas sp. TaxID=34028 RepID=UPI002FC6DFCC
MKHHRAIKNALPQANPPQPAKKPDRPACIPGAGSAHRSPLGAQAQGAALIGILDPIAQQGPRSAGRDDVDDAELLGGAKRRAYAVVLRFELQAQRLGVLGLGQFLAVGGSDAAFDRYRSPG